MTELIVLEPIADDVQGYCDVATGECVPAAGPVVGAPDQETRV